MDFVKGLFGMSGGKRKTYRKRVGRKGYKGGANCESGEACATQFSADSSLSQGETFAKMTRSFHGGNRSRRMRGGAADLSHAFEMAPADIHQRAGTDVLDTAIAELSRFAPMSQSGGSAELNEAFQLPDADLLKQAGTSVLDTAMAQLSRFMPAKGGKRSRSRSRSRRTRANRKRGGALGNSPIDAPDMLLRPEDYPAAFLNPQWVQENVVNPNFNGPANALIAAPSGGARRGGRRSTRKSHKGGRKATKKCRRGKVYRKTFIRKGRRIFGKCVRKP